MLLCAVSLFFAANGAKANDSVVGKENVTIQFVTDAINTSGGKLFAVISPADNQENYRILYNDSGNNQYAIVAIERYFDGAIWVETTKPLLETFKGDRLALLNATNEANYDAIADAFKWPGNVFEIGSNNELRVIARYDYGQKLSQNELANYFAWLTYYTWLTYIYEPTLVEAYGNWSYGNRSK